MSLTAPERDYVERRRKLLSAWPWAGGAILLMLAGFAAWLFVEVPLMINPWATMEAVAAGTVEETTLAAMAVMLPVLMLAVLGVLGVVVLLLFAAFAQERKLIHLLQREDAGHA